MKREELKDVVTVKSANVDLGQALPYHIRDSISHLVEKYFDELIAAPVYFSREGQQFRCTVNLQIGSLPMISARGLGVDCYRAFALAMEKAAKQLRRMKREVRDNRARRPARAANMPNNARL